MSRRGVRHLMQYKTSPGSLGLRGRSRRICDVVACSVLCAAVATPTQSRPYKIKCSPCSITERRVPELIPVLGSQPAGDVSHKPGDRLPLLSVRPAVTLATL